MSSVFAVPQVLGNAASDLAGIGSVVDAANTAATGPTTTMLAAGADEVSTAVKSLFSAHARACQEVSTQAAEFHAQFVRALTGAGGAYAAAESANVAPLQGVAQAIESATNYGYGHVGIGNVGTGNVGTGNVGTGNTGFPVSLLGLLGVGNHGSYNQGLFNYGNYNLGIGLTGDHRMGVGPFYVTH